MLKHVGFQRFNIRIPIEMSPLHHAREVHKGNVIKAVHSPIDNEQRTQEHIHDRTVCLGDSFRNRNSHS